MNLKIIKIFAGCAAYLISMLACASDSGQPVESVVQDSAFEILNIPRKSLISVVVTYPPRGSSLPHRHAKSAFIYANVLDGEIQSSVDGSSPHAYKAGESWSEPPGAHHAISQNASDTSPAHLLAIFVVDTDDKNLTMPDR